MSRAKLTIVLLTAWILTSAAATQPAVTFRSVPSGHNPAQLAQGTLGPEVTAPVSAPSAVRAQLDSFNWGGFIDGATTTTGTLESTGQSFSESSATWTVPQLVTPPNQGYEATWVGIGGVLGTQNLLQVGTIEVVSGPQEAYVGFWEDYPNPLSVIQQVQPGDSISASVTYSASGGWSVVFTDTPKGGAATTTTIDRSTFSGSGYSFYAPDTSTAEWIVEDPECGRQLCPFADFQPETFSTESATATSTGGTPVSPLESVIVNQALQPEVSISPSAIYSSLGASFTVTRLLPGAASQPSGHAPGGGNGGPAPGGPPPPGGGHGGQPPPGGPGQSPHQP